MKDKDKDLEVIRRAEFLVLVDVLEVMASSDDPDEALAEYLRQVRRTIAALVVDIRRRVEADVVDAVEELIAMLTARCEHAEALQRQRQRDRALALAYRQG